MPFYDIGLGSLYLDFDSFFASAEQHLRPELRRRPVGVAPLPGESSCLIAASREAKVFGFKVGTPVREARRICPDITIVTARPDAYVRLHHAILAVINKVLPIQAVRSIDELTCTLLWNEQARAHDLACQIKAALAQAFSPGLTCSIGIGPNELIAKIAAEMNKPDGLVIIPPSALPDALYGLKLRDVPGIAAGHAERLERAGIADMPGLLALASKQMRALWGNVEGERLHVALHGGKVERPPTQRGMFGHSRVLPPDWRGPNQIAGCARLLLAKAARRLRRENFHARALSFHIRQRDKSRWYAEERFPPAGDDRVFMEALTRLLRQAYVSGAMHNARSVYVMLHDISPSSDIRPDLLMTDYEKAERARWEKLAGVTDRLAARFGHSAAMLGVQLQPPGGFAGAKIAFGRIPDMADFDQ
jgi:DNA polymerase IV